MSLHTMEINMNRLVFLPILLLLINCQSWASGENILIFTEKVSLELVDFRDLDKKIHFELFAPIKLGRINRLTISSDDKSAMLDGYEFQKFGLPVMGSLQITNSSRDIGIIYVKMRFIDNSIGNSNFENKKCYLNLVFKDFKYQYQRVSVEHNGAMSFLYYVPNCLESNEVSYRRFSDLSNSQKQVIQTLHEGPMEPEIQRSKGTPVSPFTVQPKGGRN